MPLLLPSVTFGQVAEVERVIVTGSNIPTAEETGPNPVDTYRPGDIEKVGIRNATDLTTFLPQQSGATTNLNMGNGGDGTVQFNLRGLLAKEEEQHNAPVRLGVAMHEPLFSQMRYERILDLNVTPHGFGDNDV